MVQTEWLRKLDLGERFEGDRVPEEWLSQREEGFEILYLSSLLRPRAFIR